MAPLRVCVLRNLRRRRVRTQRLERRMPQLGKEPTQGKARMCRLNRLVAHREKVEKRLWEAIRLRVPQGKENPVDQKQASMGAST